MFCRFTCKNYRSYRDETVFTMQAATMKEFPDSLLVDAKDGQKYLPVTVLHGSNGSGKTNLYAALNRICSAVSYPIYLLSESNAQTSLLAAHQANNKLETLRPQISGHDPFLFDSFSWNEPSEFELIHRTKLQEYTYKLALNKSGIVYEALFRQPIGQKHVITIFERTNTTIVLGSFLKRMKVGTQFNSGIPYLSWLRTTYDLDQINAVADWICSVRFINFDTMAFVPNLERTLSKHDEGVIVGILNSAGIPLEGYRIETDEQGNRTIWVSHKNMGASYEIPLSHESKGTLKLMSLAVDLNTALKEGTFLVVNDLDANLHPKLISFIVSLFKNPHINRHQAQLFFTSHDAAIMRNNVFRRDEIWFVDRTKTQTSRLWSLADIHEPSGNLINKNASYDKQYLTGRYGAVPAINPHIYWNTELPL